MGVMRRKDRRHASDAPIETPRGDIARPSQKQTAVTLSLGVLAIGLVALTVVFAAPILPTIVVSIAFAAITYLALRRN